MLTLGSLTLAAPFALLALLLLPGLWWLLRLTPPAPKRIAFPPVRFLAGLASTASMSEIRPDMLAGPMLRHLSWLNNDSDVGAGGACANGFDTRTVATRMVRPTARAILKRDMRAKITSSRYPHSWCWT